jgi:2,3-bisphosphoglycerate-independent phosphoglycerate mutase
MRAPEIICLLNGLTDVPLNDLDGATPLQKSSHPTLDRLVQEGSALRVEPPPFGGHETSLLTLLGIHDGIESAACGPLQAAALGIALTPTQRAYSICLASAGEGTIVEVADTLASDSEGHALCTALTQTLADESCRFIHVAGARALLITEHPAFYKTTTRHLGPADVVGRHWHKILPKGVDKKPARRLLERAHEVLAHHEVNQVRSELEEDPLNALVLSDGGGRPAWQPLLQTDTLLHTFDPTLIGVAKSCGVPLWRLPRPDAKFGLLRTLLGSLDHALSQCNRLILDIPYLWQATIRGDLLEKVKTIEWLDRHFLTQLHEYCWARSIRLTVMPLRRTDIRRGAVTPGWVPCATYPATTLTHAQRFEEDAF